ncbi:MAG TPA: hypothetical protein VMV14_08725 [Acidimicrobiales bacterium]|nr:hypothetical protein [Acidimicrobiales bacterium]
MAKFLLAYTGGKMGETPEAQQQQMDLWMGWFGSLGEAIVDPGNPLGTSASVSADGSVSDSGRLGLNGYSVITADSLHDAVTKAKGCPVLSSGGSVDVYEAMPIG